MEPLLRHPSLKTQHPLFSRNPEIWDGATPPLHSRIYHKDSAILHHGDAATSLWLVLEGWIKLTRQTPDGKESIVALCTAGELFGEAALFAHANYPYHAEVVGADAELMAIPSAKIRDMVALHPRLSQHIMELLNHRMAQTQLKLEHMTTMSAAQRLGCFLLRLCKHEAEGKKNLQIPIEKSILAAYLGMKPETLSRSQQQLKPLGVTVSGHQITIENIAHLRDFVCNSCSDSGHCEAEDAATPD